MFLFISAKASIKPAHNDDRQYEKYFLLISNRFERKEEPLQNIAYQKS